MGESSFSLSHKSSVDECEGGSGFCRGGQSAAGKGAKSERAGFPQRYRETFARKAQGASGAAGRMIKIIQQRSNALISSSPRAIWASVDLACRNLLPRSYRSRRISVPKSIRVRRFFDKSGPIP
jgi:hypothetical protein